MNINSNLNNGINNSIGSFTGNNVNSNVNAEIIEESINGSEVLNNNGVEETVRNTKVVTRIHGYDISGLRVGDVITGQVLSSHDGDVYLLFEEDNSVLKASLKQKMRLALGQEFSFVVNDKSNGTILLKLLGGGKKSYDLVSKSLEAAGLKVNDKNVTIVNALIDKGQPIDKQSIVQYMKLASQYGIENIDRLIDMKTENIQINEENFHMYDRYLNAEHKIMGDMEQVSDNLSKYIENVVTKGMSYEDGAQINELLKQMAEIFDTKDNVEATISEKPIEANENNQIVNDNENNVVSNENVSDKTNIADSEVINDISDELKSVKEHIKFEEVIKDFEKVLDKLNNTSESEEVDIKSEVDKINEKIKSIFKDKLCIDFDFRDKDGVQVKEEIEKIYEKFIKLTEVVKDTVMDDKGSALKESAKEMKNNLTFMNELNHVDPYVQIPFKMSSQEADGDLYVYARKRKEELYKDVLSAYLHLNMENLGSTDIDVKVKEKHVEMYFTVDNREAEELIMEHMYELIYALEDKGYSSIIHARTIENLEENYKPLYPLIGAEERMIPKKKFAVDIKA